MATKTKKTKKTKTSKHRFDFAGALTVFETGSAINEDVVRLRIGDVLEADLSVGQALNVAQLLTRAVLQRRETRRRQEAREKRRRK